MKMEQTAPRVCYHSRVSSASAEAMLVRAGAQPADEIVVQV